MAIKTVLSATGYEEIKNRIESLTPNSERQWGKMDVAQMLAHCSKLIEQTLGKIPFKDESNFLSRTVIRWIAFKNMEKGAFAKDLPTVKGFAITDERQFALEKKRLLDNLTDFYAQGQNGHLMPHPAFGQFTNEEWGQFMHLHLAHHLTQFSV
jgi:hypothetical protein